MPLPQANDNPADNLADAAKAGAGAPPDPPAEKAAPAGGQDPADGQSQAGGDLPPDSTTKKVGIAIGVTYSTTDVRKYSLDVTSLTKVTCKMVAVPPPAELMALVSKLNGTDGAKRKDDAEQ